MFQYTCLNPISHVGLDLLTDDYKKTDDINAAEAESTIFRLTNAQNRESLYSIHRAQMQTA